MTAGIHEVFRGSTFFSNAGVGKINKNLNIESKDFCAITGKLSEAFRPLFSPVQQKAKKLPKKIGNEQNGLCAILMNR